ncbi:MAG: 50S ribosomal protein L18 [Mycobacteriales bacterium]
MPVTSPTATRTKPAAASASARRRTARARRRFRLRKRVVGTTEQPRLAVTRSARHIFAQVIDDSRGVTIASASTYKLGDGGDKTAQARKVGEELAALAKSAGVTRVVFDRGGNAYQGRIAALADAAREAGLEF